MTYLGGADEGKSTFDHDLAIELAYGVRILTCERAHMKSTVSVDFSLTLLGSRSIL